MKFYLTDRVLELQSGKRIVAVKSLSLAEEYLQDHFPTYPVLPGVLMLESLIQAAAWLVRASEDFSHSMVVLDEVRNARYGSFFKPGTIMQVEVELLKSDPAAGLWTFKGIGAVGEQMKVQAGKFTMKAFNLADGQPLLAETDRQIVAAMRQRWAMIAPRAIVAAQSQQA